MGTESDETGGDPSDSSGSGVTRGKTPSPEDPNASGSDLSQPLAPEKGNPKSVVAAPERDDGSEHPDGEWPEGEEGGPVKSFLEHLEDLRWTLIKSGASILIAMILCLVAATHLVEVLKAPLNDALKQLGNEQELVLLRFGTNVLWRIPGSDWPAMADAGAGETNQMGRGKAFRLVPRASGSNYVFVLEADTSGDVDEKAIQLKSYDPLAPFTIALSIALYGGLGLASPFVLFFVGQFVVPALKRTERRYLFQGLAVGSVLFAAGVCFCYFVMVKIALYAAVMFAKWMSFSADEWRAGEYISFVCKFLLGMGLAFELPVVLLTLVRIRLLDYRALSKFRMYWVVIEMVVASILTPPDPATMFMMAIPLHLLYEFSVLVAWYWDRKERREQGG